MDYHTRLFTSKLLMRMLDNLNIAYVRYTNLHTEEYLLQVNHYFGWFGIYNIPLRYSNGRYNIADKTIKERIIPLEHEAILNELNEYVSRHPGFAAYSVNHEVRKEVQMMKILLEAFGYKLEFRKKEVVLSGVSE